MNSIYIVTGLSFLVLACPIVYGMFSIIGIKKRITQSTKISRAFAPRSLEELLNILNFTIEKEIMFRLRIELELKRSTRMITKFNDELSTLSKNVVNALSQDYYDELSYYYKTDYVLRYIVKTIQLYLIKYMDDNKITTK
jgi:hypothetical protein